MEQKGQYMVDFVTDGSDNSSAYPWMYINLAVDKWYGAIQSDISFSV